MNKPILVILAAGMGSRFGGLKQLEPIGANGELIIDYSIFDAKRAGFERVVFIIKKEIEEVFKKTIGERIEKHMQVNYAYQELDKLPAGFSVPQGRIKPFGTSHALICAKKFIDAPFAIINADDYYGVQAYKKIFDFLTKMDETAQEYAMMGYRVENTVTDKGSVTRGICVADKNEYLQEIVETSDIEKFGDGARVFNKETNDYDIIEKGSLVSMNYWGLNPSFIDLIERDFVKFLDENLKTNPEKCEYLLPNSVADLIPQGVKVKVLDNSERWYGITYKEDQEDVVNKISQMHQDEKYPTPLWK
ncbi:MAG: sugar phosphate nucleotidyltransferase [Clostridia bacterium]